MTISTQHPDLVRILDGIASVESQITQQDLDAVGKDTHTAVDRLLGPLADPDSVRAVAVERTTDLTDPVLLLVHPQATLRSAWMDGFTAGVKFQQAGGHVTDSDS